MAANNPQENPLGSPLVHIKMCEFHDSPTDIICEYCDKFNCVKCAKTDHKDHNWKTLPTAATERRRNLPELFRKSKERDIPRVEEKIEMISERIIENKELCDTEIRKLQRHYDEMISRLKRENGIVEAVKFMEDNNVTMSDYSLIDNHRELTQLQPTLDVDLNDCKHSVRYSKGEINDEVLHSLSGKTLYLNDISLTEENSFNYGDRRITLLRASNEDESYIRQSESICTEYINTKSAIKDEFKISPSDMCVTKSRDVYFNDFKNKTISSLSPSGAISIVISTDLLEACGICESLAGGLLVTLSDIKSNYFQLESHSRRLLRHITLTGDVIKEYEYQEDGQTRLFTWPTRVTQNSNCDISVVNGTSSTMGNLVIIFPTSRIRSVYHIQNLSEDFKPTDVVCDSLCNILVTDLYNKRIHLLCPDGLFLKFLLTKNETYHPFRLSLYKSTLVIGKDPKRPLGICQSMDGRLLITLINKALGVYNSDIWRIDVIHEYNYQMDSQTRLFTFPNIITQNHRTVEVIFMLSTVQE
ncbi:uncharacterized protein LOC134271196, partial [Saccostrea cucullata]|uniref:uncharacterized protein LOC134271196 n=1 Tax=Saccostrea cuccullata TaxID=36930 RepID=UPI002ED4C418